MAEIKEGFFDTFCPNCHRFSMTNGIHCEACGFDIRDNPECIPGDEEE